MKLLRRLDDALCAFVTGHSRRDMDRVRMRRLALLGGRLSARLRREASVHRESLFLGDILAEHKSASADAADSLVRAILDHRDRSVAAILLAKLEVDRASLYTLHIGRGTQIRARGRLSEDTLKRLDAAFVRSNERYGKLLEGLGKHRVLDALQHKLRLRIGNWHGFLHRCRLGWDILRTGRLPVSMLHREYFDFQPLFRLPAGGRVPSASDDGIWRRMCKVPWPRGEG